MKKSELGKATVARALKPVDHLNRQIPPEPHTAMYVWHKYWSRKTWNVVGEFIRHCTAEQEVVFDPFAGSGVVAIEEENWRLVYFDALRQAYLKSADRTDVNRLVDVKGALEARKTVCESRQMAFGL